MRPSAEARLRTGIRLAAEILDLADYPGDKLQLFAFEAGAGLSFSAGAFVLQHCGIRVTRTCNAAVPMLTAWLNKARAKLGDATP